MGTRLRKYFISGLVLFLPLALTVYLLALTINVADNFLGRFIAPYFLQEFGFYFKGLGIVICALLIFLIGFVVTNFIGRKLYVFFERLLLRLPFFKQVYPAIKDLAVFLFAKEHARFKQVVFIEYPRKGI